MNDVVVLWYSIHWSIEHIIIYIRYCSCFIIFVSSWSHNARGLLWVWYYRSHFSHIQLISNQSNLMTIQPTCRTNWLSCQPFLSLCWSFLYLRSVWSSNDIDHRTASNLTSNYQMPSWKNSILKLKINPRSNNHLLSRTAFMKLKARS